MSLPLIPVLWRLGTPLLAVALVSACAGGAGWHTGGGDANTSAVSGELVYRQRIALSPEAVIDVRLVDVDRGAVLARQEIQSQGRQVPIPFRLEYATADFVTGNRHMLLATVRDASGRLRWAADAPVSVADGSGEGGIRVRLAQVGHDEDTLMGTEWRLLRIVSADGRIEWARARRPSTLTFGGDGRVGGNAACNSFFASYEPGENGALQIGRAGATLMACPEPNLAQPFLKILGQVESYALAGNRLRLIADDATLVLVSEG